MQVLGGRGEPGGGGRSAVPGPRTAAPGDSDSGEGHAARSPAGADGDPASAEPGARLPGAAGGRPAPGRRDLGRVNGKRSSIDWAPPGGRVCPGERVRKAEGQEVGLLQRGWRDRAGTEPSLFMCLPALACFLRRLQGESPSCRPRV
uniref:collagen alpha-1(III) chain-like n=1 Tax=Ictidomys tridecemlineatus TaxID=43179 RepID=UPI001A9E0006|nr:collagen alpha-1(III) chain-like [Ictidomys tridecemlineatus]